MKFIKIDKQLLCNQANNNKKSEKTQLNYIIRLEGIMFWEPNKVVKFLY